MISALLAAGSAVQAQSDSASVAAAWARYVGFTKAVNSDSVAGMYTVDAELLQPGAAPIHGRAAVRAFLKPFDGHAHVDTVTSSTAVLEVYGSVAYEWGSYHQVARLDVGAAGTYDGRFVCEWKRDGDGSWRIRRLLMQPAPPLKAP